MNFPAAAPLPPARRSFRLLTDAERQASLDRSLSHWTSDQDVWIFGYGSLVWRPEFDFAERRLAVLNGYHRSLCLWSRVNRGTPELPGLVFGLDKGGSCKGVVFRIPARDVKSTMRELWKREMPSGAYIPKWLNCRTRQGEVRALAFTMDRSTDAYVRGLPPEELIAIVQRAHGHYGPCTEYVLETAQALEQHGILDKKLQAVALRLRGPARPKGEAGKG